MSKEQTSTKTPSFTTALLEKMEAEITQVKVSGSVNYHLMRRAGLKRRSLTIRYQILQIMEYLRGKQFKKYRKHYADRKEELRVADEMPFYVENEKGKMVSNYNNIGKAYDAILEALKESENLLSQSGKGPKLRQFKTATAKIRKDVDVIINGKTDEEVITDESKAA